MSEMILAGIDVSSVQTLAQTVCKSKLCNVQKPEDAFVILMTGIELGLKPMQALRGIHVINGKPVFSADLMMAACLRHPDCIRFVVVEMDVKRATVEVMRRGWDSHARYSFSEEDAKCANLWGKGNWKTYPADMLKARAISRAARAAFADALMGVYVEGELDGDPPPPSQPSRAPEQTPSRAEHESAEVEDAEFVEVRSTGRLSAADDWELQKNRLWALLGETDLTKDEREAAYKAMKARLGISSLKEVDAKRVRSLCARLNTWPAGAARSAELRNLIATVGG